MKSFLLAVVFVALLVAIGAERSAAQAPDHPVITEVFQNPPAGGGPVGRNPADPHQEFIEIYIPPAADLAPGLNKDALNLTFYDVEGDASSPGLSLVNYRIDLPTFDLDPSNGLTGLERPASGVVVLGWVDYVGNPPTDLAGTPSTRIALIDGGRTSTTDFTFIAINGAQFSGTTNFPVPAAISHIDLVSDPSTGKIEQGSGVYLLVDRDDPGYVELCGQTDPAPCSSFPNLPGGTVLATSSLLDAFAANDDSKFDVTEQPYAPPTGDNIDLEFVLPLGGAFSTLAPQVPEGGDGYRRLFGDIVKTTEDGIPGNEDPVADAVGAYRVVSNLGPFVPTPGRVPFTTSPAELQLADASLQSFQVLTNTRARPGLVAANGGGHFGMVTLTTPGPTADPSAMLISMAASSFAPVGQVAIAPAVEVETFATTPAGHTEVVSVQVDAIEGMPGDPPVVNPSDTVTETYTAIDPTTGLDALGLPFQATAFAAVHGIPDQLGVANEFHDTKLGMWMFARLGIHVFDTRGNAVALLDPMTDLSDPLVVDPMIASLPTDPVFFINAPGTGGDLVSTILNSAEVTSGAATYADSFNSTQTLVQAREFVIHETPTKGSGFRPTERIHYADAKGFPGAPNSGLTDVLTGRDFELALIETNLGPTGSLETGATDDFGLVVEVGQTRVGASVLPGELLFLSLTGGLEGADIDTLDVPPGSNQTVIIYLDLDPLDTVLGAETITRLFVVDGSGNGEVDIMDVIALPEPNMMVMLPTALAFLLILGRRRARWE